MACSLVQKGVCGENSSLINILAHPDYGSFQPMIKEGCFHTDCNGECMEVCTPRVLVIADEKLAVRLMRHPKWQPVMILPSE